MNIKWKIIKPPIPIIFLDTFFFIDLIRNHHKNKNSSYFQEELRLVDLIIKLTKDKKLFCPQGDQKEEYELGDYEDEIRKEQDKLSFGIKAKHRFGVYLYQLPKAIQAYVNNNQEIECNYMCLFYRDPIIELDEILNSNFRLSVHLPMPEFYLNKKRKTKKKIGEELEETRKENIALGIEYQNCVKQEILGELNFISNSIIKETFVKLIEPRYQLTEGEIEGLLHFGELLVFYSHYAKKRARTEDVFNFLKSEHFASIPYISLRSRLFASMVTQEHEVKESDVFDYTQTSQMMPFITYFLTDSSLKHRITTNPLKLDKEYDVKVFSMREIESLIKELEGL